MTASRKILLLFSIVAAACSLGSWFTYTAQEQVMREAHYIEQEQLKARGEMTFSGPYCYPDRHPQFLILLATLILTGFCIVVIARNAIWSFPMFLSAFLMFPYWVWNTRWTISMAENIAVEGLDLVLYRANAFDLASLTLLSLIVGYQSILATKAVLSTLIPDKLP